MIMMSDNEGSNSNAAAVAGVATPRPPYPPPRPPPPQLPPVPTPFAHLSQFSRAMFGMDVRSIALYRMLASSAMLYCLLIRWTDIEAMYTDVGTMPRQTHLKHGGTAWGISVHYVSGQTSIIALLFVLHATCLTAMFVGYYSRTAALLSWMMEVSLQNRNFLVLQGGDVVCRFLLMYAMLLPLGACWSLDEFIARSKEDEGEVEEVGEEGEEGDSNTSTCYGRLREVFRKTNPRIYVAPSDKIGRGAAAAAAAAVAAEEEEEEEEEEASSFLSLEYQPSTGTVVYNISTVALMLQIVQIYAYAGLLKNPDGECVCTWQSVYNKNNKT
jgi:hypothetical protein